MSDTAPKEDELYCFLPGASDRPCGADCMAYRAVTQDSEYLDSVQTHCVMLSATERVGRGMIVLAGAVGAFTKFSRNKAADDARKPPPSTIPGGQQ